MRFFSLNYKKLVDILNIHAIIKKAYEGEYEKRFII